MNREKTIRAMNGWGMLGVNILIFLTAAFLLYGFVRSAIAATEHVGALPNFYLLISGILVTAFGVFMCCGHFTLQPNEGRVLLLFGDYRGTVRTSGFHWTNPLNTKRRISLRREISMAKSSKSTTNAATRSKSPPS